MISDTLSQEEYKRQNPKKRISRSFAFIQQLSPNIPCPENYQFKSTNIKVPLFDLLPYKKAPS